VEVTAITELTKEIRALPLATVAFVAVIASLVVVAIVVVVGGRGTGRFFGLLQPLTEAVNRFTAMFDRRMADTDTREMFQTQMMMSASVGMDNLSRATVNIAKMTEKSYNRMVMRDTLDAARHEELLREIRAVGLPQERIEQIVLLTVAAGREQLREELRAVQRDVMAHLKLRELEGDGEISGDDGDGDAGAGVRC
jgi:hypothetical protein